MLKTVGDDVSMDFFELYEAVASLQEGKDGFGF